MNKILLSLLLFLSVHAYGQLPFDTQVEDLSKHADLPDDLFKKILTLSFYNTSTQCFYQSVVNKVSLSCGNIPKNKLVLGGSSAIVRGDEQVAWYASQYQRWIYEIDPNSDWGAAEKWVDNDTLRWSRVYNIEPKTLDTITLTAYYKPHPMDSVEIGILQLPVKTIPRPELELSDRTKFPSIIEKEKLLQLEEVVTQEQTLYPEKLAFSKITYFELEVKRKRKVQTFKCHDSFLTFEMKNAIKQSAKKTTITFKNVRSERIVFDSLSFRIK
ncbi:MAG: hypothetical protein AAGG75_12640 [Bacteroidota bacterium]